MPYNLLLKVFTQINFTADFLQDKSITVNICYWAPSEGWGAAYAVHLRLIGKRVVRHPICHNWTFFARCFCFVTVYAYDGRMDISVMAIPPHAYLQCSKTNFSFLQWFQSVCCRHWKTRSKTCMDWELARRSRKYDHLLPRQPLPQHHSSSNCF